jgi:hypothetical protein
MNATWKPSIPIYQLAELEAAGSKDREKREAGTEEGGSRGDAAFPNQ